VWDANGSPVEEVVMKKKMLVGALNDFEKMGTNTSQIIASRTGKKVWIANIEFSPGIDVSQSESGEEILIRVRLKDGEYLVIQDEPGLSDKRMLT